jgi:hypothetical protein
MSRQSNQKINAELFSLEPTALLEFFVIYYDYVNQPDEKLYIHGGTNGIKNKRIYLLARARVFSVSNSKLRL